MSDFQPVSWSDDDLITAEKLNQMTDNDKYLKDHAMPQLYKAYDLNKTDGLRVASGIVAHGPATQREVRFDISWAGFFSTGCKPSIQATLAVTDQVRAFITIKGIGSGNLRPENGFTVIVNADPLAETKNYFPTTFHVHWMAIGY